jgi:LmbE family N-acetylglucosaminyl deacetylase
MNSYLIVVAHPDDEVLGAGAIISKYSKSGCKVDVCILCSSVEAREKRPSSEQFKLDIQSALSSLGVNKIFLGDFPNIALNTVSHLALVQFIENAIISTSPDVLITHHPSDLNNDHYITSITCQAASRLYQRRPDIHPLSELLYMEVLSSSDWALNPSVRQFSPNIFVEIGEKGIEDKISALSSYQGVMRDYPHSRSVQTIKALATYRGSQVGVMYAEAFELGFKVFRD